MKVADPVERDVVEPVVTAARRGRRPRPGRPGVMAWAPPSRRGRLVLGLAIVAVTGFVLLPLVVIVGVSFSADGFWAFPPDGGWSMRWYDRLLERPDFLRSIWVSLATGVLATLVGLAISLPAALGIVRGRHGVSGGLGAGALLPLLLPNIAIGVGIYVLYIRVGMPINIPTLAVAQVILLLPFSIRLLMVGFSTLNPNVERAALNLGASPLRVFFRVSLPMMQTAVVASVLLIFIQSLEDTAVALFVNSAGTITVPVRLLLYQETEPGPLIAAGGTVLLVIGAVLALLVARFVGLGRAFGVSTGKG